MLGPSTLVRLFLLGVKVLALPDVPLEVAEDAGVVMVTAATGRMGLPKHAAVDDGTESLRRAQLQVRCCSHDAAAQTASRRAGRRRRANELRGLRAFERGRAAAVVASGPASSTYCHA